MNSTTPTFFENAQEFRAWLEANAAQAESLLVGYYKLGTGRASMAWSESVDEALCFGWIDGIRKRIDEHSYSIRFTPRKKNSIWSAINIAKVAQLQAQGRMTPAGEAAFAHRKEAKSAIYAYEQSATAELSDLELQTFRLNEAAWTYFENAPPGYKKTMLHWVAAAKKAETRQNRFARLLEACASGQRIQ
ncbi:MAG: bacteriocin-protection protein [Chloroflexi bacterium HGW-Chloroflexi-6]|nr:MAG: bacteriocin-protection protein [Chloroflexi bacterium HGW-Chloroflexi-6]